MSVRFRHALLGVVLVAVAFVAAVSLLRAPSVVERELVRLVRDDLQGELRLLRGTLDRAGGAGLDSLVRSVSRSSGRRVTLVDTAGVVLADSDVPSREVPLLESFRGRPEVAAALDGQVGFAERYSITVGRRLVFGAAPVRLGEEPAVLRLGASRDGIERILDALRDALLLALLLGSLASAALAYGLARSVTRPLGVLSDRIRSVTGGNLGARAPRRSRLTEIDALTLAFNRLGEEVEERIAELSRERDQIQTLIDAMAEGVIALTDDARVLRANEAARELLDLPEPILYAPVGSLVRHPELRDLLERAVISSFRAREVEVGERHLIVSARLLERGGSVVTFLDVTELRRLEQVRRDFVANASHELKTPLTSMRGFAETLLEDDPPPDLRRQFLTSIRDNTVRLQRLVDDLLDLSRLESGGWMARPEVVDVAELAREVWREMEERGEEKALEFRVEGEGLAWADEHGLEQVLRNLLENSAQYTPDGGTVTVRIEPREERISVAVRDTGIGIPSSALSRIFERFYRADPARSREAGGTGLGLAIVKHLVEAMEGEVEARSTLGRGTTIRVLLPRARDGG